MYIFSCFSWKTGLDISGESSAWQTIHTKCQNLFSLKNKEKNKQNKNKKKIIVCCSCDWRFKEKETYWRQSNCNPTIESNLQKSKSVCRKIEHTDIKQAELESMVYYFIRYSDVNS